MKNNFLYIIIAVLALLIFITTCKNGCNRPISIIKSDTLRIRDTSWLSGEIVEVPVYLPNKEKNIPAKPNDIPDVDTSNIDSCVKQYTELANNYYSKNIYNDSVKLKDERFKGKDLGTLYIKDVLSENELKSRNISYSLTFPIINNTTTITNTVQEKKKTQVYVGLGLTGNRSELINGINGLLTIKSKKNVLYGLSAGYQESFDKIHPQFGASVQIKLGKNK